MGIPYEQANKYKISAAPPVRLRGGGACVSAAHERVCGLASGLFGGPQEQRIARGVRQTLALGCLVVQGAVAASSMDDPQRWKLDHHTLFNLPPIMHAVEESSVCDRIMLTACGCLNLRAFTMHFNDLVVSWGTRGRSRTSGRSACTASACAQR